MDANGDFFFDVDLITHLYPINLIPNYSTFTVELQITSGTYQVDLTTGGLYIILGFNAAVYTVTTNSPNLVNITNGVNTLIIHCSIAAGLTRIHLTGLLYGFVPSSGPGTNIDVTVNPPIYLPLRYKDQVVAIRMYITD